MDLNLAGRTVLVTGSSKGIGLGIAQRFAAEGCDLWLAARSAEQLETAAAAIRQAHPVQVRTWRSIWPSPLPGQGWSRLVPISTSW